MGHILSFLPSLNTAQELLRLRQQAAGHLAHRLPVAGGGSSPDLTQQAPLLLGHDGVEGEVPLEGQDDARRTRRRGRELREERREVALGATGLLFFCEKVFALAIVFGGDQRRGEGVGVGIRASAHARREESIVHGKGVKAIAHTSSNSPTFTPGKVARSTALPSANMTPTAPTKGRSSTAVVNLVPSTSLALSASSVCTLVQRSRKTPNFLLYSRLASTRASSSSPRPARPSVPLTPGTLAGAEAGAAGVAAAAGVVVGVSVVSLVFSLMLL